LNRTVIDFLMCILCLIDVDPEMMFLFIYIKSMPKKSWPTLKHYSYSNFQSNNIVHHCFVCSYIMLPPVFWHCWLSIRKSIWLVKIVMMW